MIFQQLFKLKPNLPEKLWDWLKGLYWRVYWNVEQLKLILRGGRMVQQLRGSERVSLVEAVCDCFPINSVLEVGSGAAQNLVILNRVLPEVELTGLEQDTLLIAEASQNISQKKIKLIHDTGSTLSQLPDKSFDLVISCGYFRYIRADLVLGVVADLVRVSRRMLLLVEQNLPNIYNETQDLGTFVPALEGGYWLRDYQRLFLHFVTADKIKISKIKNPLWVSEQWSEVGCLIRVELC